MGGSVFQFCMSLDHKRKCSMQNGRSSRLNLTCQHNKCLVYCRLQSCELVSLKPAQITRSLNNTGPTSVKRWFILEI